MRFIYFLILVAFLAFGSWWLYQDDTALRNFVTTLEGDDQFLALEARYTPDQIMQTHREQLITSSHQEFSSSTLGFSPYLLMEGKWNMPDRRQREAVLLWDLKSGELVLDTSTWESTKGFSELLDTQAEAHDVKIVKALLKQKDGVTQEQLARELRIAPDTLDNWLASAEEKGLITKKKNSWHPVQQDGKLHVTGQTKIEQWLVTKPYRHAKRFAPRYDSEEIKEIALAAFGPELQIRSTKEVYLPIYSISVTGKRGAVSTTMWNALNGQRISAKD